MTEPIKNRYDFEIIFDVENGNPNGDPDAGNMPRIDQETGLGLVTDVCLKRKIRNYVEAAKEDAPGYRIYVKDHVPLERNNREAYKYLGVDEKKIKEAKKKDADIDLKIRDFMCENFYDIRAFGAVMTTFVNAKLNCGQVRGPVQLDFARSVEPILAQEIGISRVTVASEKEQEDGKHMMLGHKFIVPYGLYIAHGYISANLARKVTGFSEEDLALLWRAIINMFENDHSATRGTMAVRKLIVFKHESELGNAPAYQLFERIKVEKKEAEKPARAYSDYTVTVDDTDPPYRCYLHPDDLRQRMEYPEDEYLMISGIQHFAFCRRQWALIHIEQIWQENLRTAEGRILHEKCHDACQKEKRGGLLISRGLRVFSRTMGVSGVCDVVEFHEAEEGAVLHKHPGFWVPYPVEYKHGEGKSLDADRLQLCAQAMCLEEMYCTDVPKGALFYAAPHRREEVTFDSCLRERVRQIFSEMHQDMARGHTPRVKPSKACQACSLKPICLPRLMKHHDVGAYYDDALGRER